MKLRIAIVFALALLGTTIWFSLWGREWVLTVDERHMHHLLWKATHPITAPHLPFLPQAAADAYDWVPHARFFPIAHALGSGQPNEINTIAALRRSYAAGFRLFEVDISVTRDDRVICRHDSLDRDTNSFTFSDFVAENRRLGKKEDCVFADLVKAVRAYPDIHFILDVKNRFEDAYLLMRQELGTSGLGRRFIPQLYDFSELPIFRRDVFFAGPIFTSYRSWYTTQEIMTYAKQYGLPVVTLSNQRLSRLRPADSILHGRIVLGHPMDDFAGAQLWRGWGLRGIYTFVLSPASTPSLYPGLGR